MPTIKGFKVGTDTYLYEDQNIAEEFSTTKTYKVGNYVINSDDGLLYRCHTAVTTKGGWTGAANWINVKAIGDTDTTLSISGMIPDSGVTGNEIRMLKNVIDDTFIPVKQYINSWSQGGLSSVDGKTTSPSNRCRSGYIKFQTDHKLITVNVPSGYIISWREYSSNNINTFLNSAEIMTEGYTSLIINPNYYYRFVIGLISGGNITPNDIVENSIWYEEYSADQTTELNLAETIEYSRLSGYIQYIDGNTATSPTLSRTDYIYVSKYDYIYYSRMQGTSETQNSGMAFYDIDKNFISDSGIATKGSGSYNGYITPLNKVEVPSDAYYARFSYYTDDNTYGKFQLFGLSNHTTDEINTTIRNLGKENVYSGKLTGWLQGTISATRGDTSDSNIRVRTDGLISFAGFGRVEITIPSGYKLASREYSEATGGASSYVGSPFPFASESASFDPIDGHFYRFILGYNDDRNITPELAAECNITYTATLNITTMVLDLQKDSETVTEKILTALDYPSAWEQGNIDLTNGAVISSPKAIRTSYFLSFKDFDSVDFNFSSDYLIAVIEYNDNYASDLTTIFEGVQQAFTSSYFSFTPKPGAFYKIAVSRGDGANVTPSAAKTVNLQYQGEWNKSKLATVKRNMFTGDLGNSCILCAKEHNYMDGTPPTYEYFLLGENTTNRVYYSKDLETREYLFTFVRDVGEYAWGIDSENNIYCVKMAEFLDGTEESYDDSLRENPIVYLFSENYSIAHEVDFGNNMKPCGWLSNIGFSCFNSGDVMMVEYTRPIVAHANAWRIAKGSDPTDPTSWVIVKQFTVNPESTDFKHIHNVYQDFYTGVCYMTTGDNDVGSKILYLTDNGLTWTIGREGEGAETYCRLLTMTFTKTYIYWATDSYKEGMHWVLRATRNAQTGVIDFANIELIKELTSYAAPDQPNMVATYGCVYLPGYNALMLMERADHGTATSMPIRIYDITENEVYELGTLYPANPNTSTKNYLGFRTRFCQWYPRDNVINFSWHLKRSSNFQSGDGINNNKLFGNRGSKTRSNVNINNGYLVIYKDNGIYRMTMGTRYI